MSAAERFRQDWQDILAGADLQAPAAGEEEGTTQLATLFTVGARARHLASDGQPRIAPGTLSR